MNPDLVARVARMVAACYPRIRDKEDLVQEALIGAWQAQPGYEMIAARRRVIDYLRRVNHRSRSGFYAHMTHEIPESPGEETPLSIALASESLHALWRAVAQLDDQERAVIEGVLADESGRELQARVGLKERRVMQIRRSAIGKLRSTIGT